MAEKSALNELCQQVKVKASYETERLSDNTFNGLVRCCGEQFRSHTSHTTIKQAQNDAASVALEYLKNMLTSNAVPDNVPEKGSSQKDEASNPQANVDPTSGQQSLPKHSLFDRFQALTPRGVPCTAVPVPTPLKTSKKEQDKAWEELKEYTVTNNIPSPKHTLKVQNEKVIEGVLTVGNEEFRLDYPMEFNEAKHELTMKALKALKSKKTLLTKFVSKNETRIISQGYTHIQQHNQVPQPSLLTPSDFTQPKHTGQSQSVSRQVPTASDVERNGTTIDATSQGSPTCIVPTGLNNRQILNEYCQKHKLDPPVYSDVPSSQFVGYIVVVSVAGERHQSPPVSNKKNAKEMAAAIALNSLKDKKGSVQEPSMLRTSQSCPLTTSTSSTSRVVSSSPNKQCPTGNHWTILTVSQG